MFPGGEAGCRGAASFAMAEWRVSRISLFLCTSFRLPATDGKEVFADAADEDAMTEQVRAVWPMTKSER